MSGRIWDWAYAASVMPRLLDGLIVTMEASLAGAALALVLGLIVAALRLARLPAVTPAVRFAVDFLRGTPFLVQLYFLFYVLPTYGLTFSAMTTGIIGLGLYYSAYTSEVYRAGIESLPAGQWEACLVLGLPIRHVWFAIVLPQAVRVVAPVLGSYIIVIFKESALLSTITVLELMAEANDAGFLTFRFTEPLSLAGLLYFAVSYASAWLIRRYESQRPLKA